MAALALNQKKWTIVLEIGQSIENSYIMEQMKLLTLAELNYFNEMIHGLSIWQTNEKLLKHKISKNVVCSGE